MPIVEAYEGVVVETREDDPKQQFWHRFSTSFEWAEGAMYSLSDFGKTPLAYYYATEGESYAYDFGHLSQVIRDTSFEDTGMMAGEDRVSPLSIIRVLRSGRFDTAKFSIEKEGAYTVLELPRSSVPVVDRYFFEDDTGYLVRRETIGSSGKVHGRTYEDWVPVGDTGFAPSLIRLISSADDGEIVTDLTGVVSEMKALDAESPPERINPRADMTIIDMIEGVTKLADGTVLGEITSSSTAAAVPAAKKAPATTSRRSRIVMAIGIGFILLAGVIIGLRRWLGLWLGASESWRV